MLVIISDLHLTDGTSGATIPAGAFHIFAVKLHDMAFRASWRQDGSYKPVSSIDILLLGDILDVIRSSRWLQRDDARPWMDTQDKNVSTMIARITAHILKQNEESFAVLRNLTQGNSIKLPPADQNGRPVYNAAPVPVEVKTHYMVGNHDWFYHLPGNDYDALRRAMVEVMGLANRWDVPFPHDPTESEVLMDLMRRHKVFARHGDIFDPINFENDRNASSLGDAIVIQLVNRFANAVQQELGDELPEAALAGLREIDNIRPLLLIPVWIDGLLERTCPFPEIRRQVKRIWDRLADEFLAMDFVRDRDTWNPFDLVDGLEGALKFSKRLSLGWASSIAQWLNKLRGTKNDSYHIHALSEQEFRNRRSKHIVYGHTHGAEIVPLDASYADSHVHNQLYFNSGTWRRVYRQTQLAPAEHEFIPSECMTLLSFFTGDERSGRPYETWSGTLGINPVEHRHLRLDADHSKKESLNSSPSGQILNNHATQKPISTPNLHKSGPHFSADSHSAEAWSDI